MKKILCLSLVLICILSSCAMKSNEVATVDNTTTMKHIEDKPKETTTENVIENMKNEQFDEILCQGDNFYIVKKINDSYDGYFVSVGVVNSNGEWIHSLSKDNIFAKAFNDASGQKDWNGQKVTLNSDNFAYLGDGVFIASLGMKVHYRENVKKCGDYQKPASGVLECYFFNVKENIQKSFEASHISENIDGYMLLYTSGRYNSPFYSLSSKGEIRKLPCKHSSSTSVGYPIYSDGVFFAEGAFWDIRGNMVLDISNYNLYGNEYNDDKIAPYFVNGECTFKFRNNGGTLYSATIDKSGNFIKQPEKV